MIKQILILSVVCAASIAVIPASAATNVTQKTVASAPSAFLAPSTTLADDNAAGVNDTAASDNANDDDSMASNDNSDEGSDDVSSDAPANSNVQQQ